MCYLIIIIIIIIIIKHKIIIMLAGLSEYITNGSPYLYGEPFVIYVISTEALPY